MVLYHAVTVYQLLNCIVHKLLFHRKNHTVLIIPDFVSFGRGSKTFDFLVLNGIFDEVVFFPYKKIPHNTPNLEEAVESFYNEAIQHQLDKFKHIYVGGVHYYFSIYLISQNRSFWALEEANGAFSRPHILRDALQNIAPLHGENAEKYCLVDYSNPLIEKVICDGKTQEEGFFSEKLVDFNVVDGLKRIQSNELDKLLDWFSVDREIKIKHNSVFLTTQHFMNLNILGFEEHAEIYQTFVDYFIMDQNLCIKPHPEDVMNYQKLFPNSTIIKGRFPTEFLPFIFEQTVETIATIYSTSINSISDCFRKKISLSPDYRMSYKRADKYYVALKYIQSLGRGRLHINTIGVDNIHLESLAKHSDLGMGNASFGLFKCEDYYEGKIIIVDDISEFSSTASVFQLLQTIDESNIVIFLNSARDYCFYNYKNKSLFEAMHPLEIRTVSILDEERTLKADEIYIYSKNKRCLNMAKELEFEKRLESLQTKIIVDRMTPEQIKIKTLEGMLQATEERLLRYIDMERELKKNENNVRGEESL